LKVHIEQLDGAEQNIRYLQEKARYLEITEFNNCSYHSITKFVSIFKPLP